MDHVLFAPADFGGGLHSERPLGANDLLLMDLNLGSADLAEVYELRQRIYDNRTLFHEGCGASNEASQIPLDTLELCDSVNDAITQGRTLLADRLQHFLACRDKVEEIHSHRRSLEAAFEDVKKAVMHFEHACLTHDKSVATVEALQAGLGTFRAIQEQLLSGISAELPALEDDTRAASQVLRRLAGAYRMLRNANAVCSCPICLERQVDHFLMPCGHTFCKRCLQRVSTACPMCRQHIVKVSDLYFS